MKSLISRESHRPEKRYSGVYHVQGSMVTDADLDERSRITQDRTDNLGDDTIKDGVPSVGGAVAIGAGDTPSLQEGVIYADGVRGVLTAEEGSSLNSPLALISNQADFPESPSLLNVEQIIYADIWERPVYPLEDVYLADIGLHGAVTSFRTRTMTQLKTAPATDSVLSNIENGTGKFPQIGTGKLTVPEFDAGAFTDNCDPCAGTVTLEQNVANALWRLEVINVSGTPEAPGDITLAWSIENAAAIAKIDVSHEDFERPNKVYEFYSEITESHLGVFANASDAKRPAFVDDMGTPPAPLSDSSNNLLPWQFVRRWDGQAVVNINASGDVPEGDSLGGGFTISIASKVILLNVGDFSVSLDLDVAAVVAGDYWLVELRRHAPETEKVLAVKELPFGVIHHYCTMFKVDALGVAKNLTDEEVRKLSFPVLSNMPATHTGFDNNCIKLYDNAENVQEALDNLCDISADDIAFTSECDELYDNADTVQEALDALCKIDFSPHDSFRLMFDWGVLCGIVPSLIKLKAGGIEISGGSFLDRSGRITNFKGGGLDLNKLKFGDQILFKSEQELREALREGKACLALVGDGGKKVDVFVIPSRLAFGPDDPGFQELVTKCLEKKDIIDIKKVVAKLSRQEQATTNKILIASSNNNAFKGSAKLTEAEAKNAAVVNSVLINEFNKVASEKEAEIFKVRVKQAENDNPIGNTQGAARQVRQMQLATAIFAEFLRADGERMRRCICQALFPTCPPELGDMPLFVPIACLRGDFGNEKIFLEEVCPFCCRKQAMTWRSLQYFIGKGRDNIARMFGRLCCVPEKESEGGIVFEKPDLHYEYDPGRYRKFDAVEFVEDYRMIEVFTGKQPKLITDYETTIPVNDLSEADAIKTLKGNGIEIAETIDVDDSRAFEIIEEKSIGVSTTDQLISAGSVKPGDKVGLLVQDGVARGYILLEKGSGKLPFSTKTAAFSREDALKAKELITATNTAKGELTDLISLREKLSVDVSKLKTDVETLGAAREKSVAAVKEVETQLTELAKTRIEITREIEAVNKELASAEENRKTIMVAVREGQPVTVVTGNNDTELITKLAGAGITTVADISKLTTTEIKKLERAGIIEAAAATALKRKAKTFLARSRG